MTSNLLNSYYDKLTCFFNDSESELLALDIKLYKIFLYSSEEEPVTYEQIRSLHLRRIELVLGLIGFDREDFDSNIKALEYIETTQYSIKNFLRDFKKNKKKEKTRKRLEKLN
jgi:hypothetical protein